MPETPVVTLQVGERIDDFESKSNHTTRRVARRCISD